MIHKENYERILDELKPFSATLVAVSKLQSNEDIRNLAGLRQKIFGENYVQELSGKQTIFPELEWHFIGHLQTNKVKQIVPFTEMIHGVDSLKLLKEINKHAIGSNKVQDCLLQIHIAREDTKSGFTFEEAERILTEEREKLKNISIRGLMGMATLTEDENLIREEFSGLKKFFDKFNSNTFSTLSMGMTSDYKMALEEGSTMVRIGSAIFGERKSI